MTAEPTSTFEASRARALTADGPGTQADEAGAEPGSPPAEPLTPAEWRRVLGGEPFRVLVKPEQIEWAGDRAVRCISCRHAGDAGHDPWRAWCMRFRCMVSNTFSKLCPGYEAAAR